MNESLRFVVEINKYDFMRKIHDLRKYHSGERLIREFVGYPKGRTNVTFIPSNNTRKTEGDVYSVYTFVRSEILPSMETLNRTFSHPFLFYEHNMLSYFQKPEYQISLSGIIEVYLPQVWTIIVLFLFLFNFLTIAKRLVPRVHRFLVGVYDNLAKGFPSIIPSGIFIEADYKGKICEIYMRSYIVPQYFEGVWTCVIYHCAKFHAFLIEYMIVSLTSRLLGNTYEAAKKVILATYFVGCFILMEVFKANLSTKLTVDIDRNINSFEDIFKHPNMRIVFQNSLMIVPYLKKNRNDVVLEYERRFQKMNRKKGDNDDVFSQGNAVYFGSVHHFEFFCNRFYKAGKDLHYGRDPFCPHPIAFEVSKTASNRLKDLIKLRILNYWETGHGIRADILLHRGGCSKYLKAKQSLAFSKTSLGDVGAIFLAYISSMIISFLVMLIELRQAFNN